MNDFIHSVYVQPLGVAAVLAALAWALWTVLGIWFWGRRQGSLRNIWCLINLFFAAVSVGAVIYATVAGRVTGVSQTMPFVRTIYDIKAQPELIREMVMNAFLFLPFGLTVPQVLAHVAVRGSYVAAVTEALAVILSVCVEAVQYVFGFGNAELSDIVMNTLGAVIGSLSYVFCRRVTSRRDDR